MSWAAHRLSGVSCPISPAYSPAELTRQLKVAGCKALFTCLPLLDVALEGAAAAGIPESRVYLIEVPLKSMKGKEPLPRFKQVDDLISEGASMAPLEALQWTEGQGARQPAFLCSSSGSSGLPVSSTESVLLSNITYASTWQKNVMLSHRNIIAAIIQRATYESTYRGTDPEMCLCGLPQSHAYALIVITHASLYRGDGVVVLQGFDLQETLQTIQDCRLERLWLVSANNQHSRHDILTPNPKGSLNDRCHDKGCRDC